MKVVGFTLVLALVLVLSPFLVAGANADAVETILKSPTLTVGNWVNATNAFTSDDVYAVADFPSVVYRSNFSGFGFELNPTASIQGVVFLVEHKTNDVLHMVLTVDSFNGSAFLYHILPLNTTETVSEVDVTSDFTWTPELANSLLLRLVGRDRAGVDAEIFVDSIVVKITFAEEEAPPAASEPKGEGPTTAVEVPNLPWYVKQLLQQILDFLGQRHVRVVLGVTAFMGIGLIVLRWEKGKKHAKF